MIPGIGLRPGMFIPKVANGLLNGLVSDFEFEETSGTTCADSKGSNSGVIYGCTLNQTGKEGKCYLFTAASSNYIEKTSPVGLSNLSNGAISLWFKWTGRTSNACLLCISAPESQYKYLIVTLGQSASLYSNESINLGIINQDPQGSWANYPLQMFVLNGETYYRDGTWHHLVVSLGGSSSGNRIYVDGVEQTVYFPSGSNSADYFTNFGVNATDLRIGNRYMNYGGTYYNDLFMNGNIDQLRIYNTALTATKVAALYNLGNGIPFAQLTT